MPYSKNLSRDFRGSRRATQMRATTTRALRQNPIAKLYTGGNTESITHDTGHPTGFRRKSRARNSPLPHRQKHKGALGAITQTAQQKLEKIQRDSPSNKDIVFTNGKAVSFSRQSTRLQITKTREQLELQNYLSVSSGNHTLSSISDSVINSLSIRATKQKRNFTLMNSQNDNETIQNPSIVDPDINSLTPDPIGAKDKFQNPCDPFYNADDDRTESQKVIYEKLTQTPQIGIVLLANNLSIKNLSVTKKKNKFFINRGAYVRSRY